MACGGWGSPWGLIPWGGSVCPEEELPPTGGWERVRQYRELRQEYVVNCVFRVEGVSAEAVVGKVRVRISPTPPPRPRRVERELPPPVEYVAHALVAAPILPPAVVASSGAPQIFADALLDEIRGVAMTMSVGIPKVRAIRNPTDEELLMMIAELV